MDGKFHLFHLYNKKVLSHGAFRLYRLLLDIEAMQSRPTPIKASRGLLGSLIGLSENSIKAAITELLDLELVVLKSERPSHWQINPPENFNHKRLAELLAEEVDTAKLEADFSRTDAK